MNKQQAEATLLKLANSAQMTGGKGFRQFSTKTNGGSKNRNTKTWVDKLTRKVDPYFGTGPDSDKYN